MIRARGYPRVMRAMVFASMLAIWPTTAWAQDAPEPERPGADEYTQLVAQGVSRMTQGDSSGAIDSFRQALSNDGARPHAPYYLAVANRVGGDLDAAVSGFQRAAELAMRADEPRWQARSLQGVASTLERMEGRLEDAREAWQAYVTFADAHPTLAFPMMGRARIQAIDMLTEQENVYGGVRERIAEREREQAEESGSSRGRRGRRSR